MKWQLRSIHRCIAKEDPIPCIKVDLLLLGNRSTESNHQSSDVLIRRDGWFSLMLFEGGGNARRIDESSSYVRRLISHTDDSELIEALWPKPKALLL